MWGAQTLVPDDAGTAFWNLAHGMPSAPLLEELTSGWDMGSEPDPVSLPRLVQSELLGLVPRVHQSQGSDNGPQTHRR
jgi:hypothetical protein